MADSSDSVSIDMEALSLGGQVRFFLVFLMSFREILFGYWEITGRRKWYLLILFFFFFWFLHSSSCFVPDNYCFSGFCCSFDYDKLFLAISGIVCSKPMLRNMFMLLIFVASFIFRAEIRISCFFFVSVILTCVDDNPIRFDFWVPEIFLYVGF